MESGCKGIDIFDWVVPTSLACTLPGVPAPIDPFVPKFIVDTDAPAVVLAVATLEFDPIRPYVEAAAEVDCGPVVEVGAAANEAVGAGIVIVGGCCCCCKGGGPEPNPPGALGAAAPAAKAAPVPLSAALLLLLDGNALQVQLMWGWHSARLQPLQRWRQQSDY